MQRLATVGRNVDRIDSFPDHYLGVSVTCCVTTLVWVLLIPLFDLAGIPWIRSWEGGRITLAEFVLRAEESHATPQDAFHVFDENEDAMLSLSEFTTGAGKFTTVVTEMEAAPIFKSMDKSWNGYLTEKEFYEGIHSGSKLSWRVTPHEFKRRGAMSFTSPRAQFEKGLDIDGDGKASYSEFLTGSHELKPPVEKQDSKLLFKHFDQDSSNAVEGHEFFMDLQGCNAHMEKTYPTPKEAFDVLDPDRSGNSSREEFMTGVNTPEPLDALSCFEDLDLDKDGYVLAVEFFNRVGSQEHWNVSQDLFKERAAAQYGSWLSACQHGIDLNADGKVTTREFLAIAARLKPVVSKADALEIFSELDRDKDGSITLAECSVSINEYKSRLSRAYGSPRKGCEQMDTNDDNMVDFAEFKAGVAKLTPSISPGEQEDLFHNLDINNDQLISPEECYIHPGEFRRRVNKTGDVMDVFTNMDLNMNHSLSHHEFVHGRHILVDPIPKDEMEELLRMMDVNHNDAIEFDEFIGNATAVAIKLTAKELAKYKSCKAVVTGSTQIFFNRPVGGVAPSHEEVSLVVIGAFEMAMEDFCHTDIDVGSCSVVNGKTEEQQSMTAHVTWESVLDDPVQLALAAMKESHAMTMSLRRTIKEANVAWTDGSHVTTLTELTYEFFGENLEELPLGPSLAQRFGEIPAADNPQGTAVIQL